MRSRAGPLGKVCRSRAGRLDHERHEAVTPPRSVIDAGTWAPYDANEGGALGGEQMFRLLARLGWAALFVAIGLGLGVNAYAAPSVPTTPAVLACGAKQASHVPAPGPKRSETFAAGVAGEVKLLQTDDNTLTVKSVTLSSGWTDTVAVGSGTSVRVTFFGQPQEQVRFVGRLNSTAARLTVTVVRCSAPA